MTSVLSRKAFATLGLFILLVGCGGGTTGTSPTNIVRVNGYAEDSSGSRASSIEMDVVSADSNQLILSSGTNARGNFNMSIPGSEHAFVIVIGAARSAPIVRSFSGEGTLTTKLAITSSSVVSTSDTFEAKVDEGSLCSALALTGNSIVITADAPQSCSISFLTSSQTLSASSFQARTVGSCAGRPRVLPIERSTESGRLTINLSPLLQNGCSDISIAISSTEAPDLITTFSVE